MDAPKSRPTVTITSYLANNSSYLRQQQDGTTRQHGNTRAGEDESHATKCEFSTNLFRNHRIRRQVNIVSNAGLINGQELSKSHHAATPVNTDGPTTTTTLTTGSSRWLSDLSQIRGPTGSVRGHKDVVRKSLEGIKVTYNNKFTNFTSSLTTSAAASSSWSSSSSSSSGGHSMLSLSTFFAGRHGGSAANTNGNHGTTTTTTSLTSFNSNKPPRLASMTGSSLLMTIDNELFCSEYLERLAEDEQDLCVAYTTTLGVIRRTFEDSKMLRSILDLNLVRYEERDIYLNQEYKCQLRMRSSGGGGGGGGCGGASGGGTSAIVVPALYVDGVHIGGAKEVEAMNESGELAKLLAKFKMSQAPREICHCCGNAKFIACQSCNGSRKSTIHHFKFNSVALRCIKCDNNDGLVQCPVCSVKPFLDEVGHQQQELCGSKLKCDILELARADEDQGPRIKTLSSGDGGQETSHAIDLVDMNNNVEC